MWAQQTRGTRDATAGGGAVRLVQSCQDEDGGYLLEGAGMAYTMQETIGTFPDVGIRAGLRAGVAVSHSTGKGCARSQGLRVLGHGRGLSQRLTIPVHTK